MRVITFSRFFPAYHPRKGEPTYFVEKIWEGLRHFPLALDEIANHVPELELELQNHYTKYFEPKWHTIRSGNRWKVGEYFSPRIWSGKPYASKQVDISAPIEIKNIWNIYIEMTGVKWFIKLNGESIDSKVDFNIDDFVEELALNDGLMVADFLNWFKVHNKKRDNTFSGQIICWNENINY